MNIQLAESLEISRVREDLTDKSELVERSEPDDPHGTVAGTSMALPLLASRLSEIAAEYRQTKDLGKFVEEIISLNEEDRDALMSFSIKVLSAIDQGKAIVIDDNGKPITPRTGNPQAAPAPQEGKDTTPTADGPETPPEGK